MRGSAELCRERPNENSRTKYYDSSHADEQDASHPEEPATGLKKRRVAPPNSLHQRVRIALCFALCAGCKLRKHKAIQAVNFPVLLVITGELKGSVPGDELHVRHDGLTGRKDGLQLLFCAANEDLLNRNHNDEEFRSYIYMLRLS